MSEDRKFSLIVAGTEVLVTRKSIRNAYIRVMPPYGEVRASVPEYMKKGEITAFIGSRMGWIREKQKKYEDYKPLQYVSGERLRFWGRDVTLEFEDGKRSSYSLENDHLRIYARKSLSYEDREAVIRKIYGMETRKMIENLADVLEARTGLCPSVWKVRYMTSRWGSCNTGTRAITISSRLAAYPPECLEQVMVHELCHLKVHGHGKDFYDLMDRYYPDWKRIKKMLKEQIN